jgi:hypothetical protein
MVTEIQVDNWVKISTTNTKVTQTILNNIISGATTYTAIALTEQWLLDLGFVKTLDDVSNRFIYSLAEVGIKYQQVRAIADIYFNGDYQDSTDCVHQLQNVYQGIKGVMITK